MIENYQVIYGFLVKDLFFQLISFSISNLMTKAVFLGTTYRLRFSRIWKLHEIIYWQIKNLIPHLSVDFFV